MPWRAGSEGPPAATASLLPSSPPESGIALCTFFTKGLCEKGDRNKERPFLHVKPAFKTQDCPWYDRGFCKHDLLCKYQHVCRTKCTNYLAGFCLEGPRCQFAHLSSSPWVPYVLLPGNPASPAPWQECLPPHPQTRPHESGAAHCLGLRCWSGACATG